MICYKIIVINYKNDMSKYFVCKKNIHQLSHLLGNLNFSTRLIESNLNIKCMLLIKKDSVLSIGYN